MKHFRHISPFCRPVPANLLKALRLIFKLLPKRIFKVIRVAAFDTSLNLNWLVKLFAAAKPLNKKLRQLGGKQIVPTRSFFVADQQGPLCEGEIERAKTWAEAILAQYKLLSERKQAT